MPDSRTRGRAGFAGRTRSAGAKWKRRAALGAVAAVGVAVMAQPAGAATIAAGSAALSAVDGAGVGVVAQPARAATVSTTVTAASSCRPKTDFMESRTNSGSGAWAGNFCGTGYRHPWHKGSVWEHFNTVWDATSPSYRVWFHENGKSWCAWGSSHKAVPLAFRVPGNILITTDTARCP